MIRIRFVLVFTCFSIFPPILFPTFFFNPLCTYTDARVHADTRTYIRLPLDLIRSCSVPIQLQCAAVDCNVTYRTVNVAIFISPSLKKNHPRMQLLSRNNVSYLNLNAVTTLHLESSPFLFSFFRLLSLESFL